MPAYTFVSERDGLTVDCHPDMNDLLQKVRALTQADFRVLCSGHEYKRWFRAPETRYYYSLVVCLRRDGEAEMLVESGHDGIAVVKYLEGLLAGIRNADTYLTASKMYGFTRSGVNLPQAFLVARQVFEVAFSDAHRHDQYRSYARAIAISIDLDDYNDANEWLEQLYQKLQPELKEDAVTNR